ncbi:bifunctional adenosylcobinamide kinase/adenosylcobinamide-phosphate guanylyltransferase [Sphaerotilus sp.]|uniref:bifunctional adenosylcobinamide kinase/adenosylcobinamide-phosphate guanylyltransferase n=1 Tax=Sphaerotilus sp. TaxID=2093942 RepID=UPI002ACE2636|nr:bifunctional adenosylcobinamide kinase/adenosylcobinamide-phosphate guanylyltransferase [Sphaerotilus sp.]MDZ7856242.1 bifunctional adenosylcobinamide kinase/adenosylcobinamide-phosphate guanylyltransferase [Sphaerotilus sp.]
MHPCSEFILGGQRSGKSRCGEQRAADWLAAQPGHRAVLLATAIGGDDEMRARIRRHQADRAERVPAMALDEVRHDLAGAIRRHSALDCLVLVDCLTLWLTQWLMPLEGEPVEDTRWLAVLADLDAALLAAPGPVVLVSNEIGLGLAPMSREARRYVDALGRLHQRVAARCPQVTLMVAGLEMTVKSAVKR